MWRYSDRCQCSRRCYNAKHHPSRQYRREWRYRRLIFLIEYWAWPFSGKGQLDDRIVGVPVILQRQVQRIPSPSPPTCPFARKCWSTKVLLEKRARVSCDTSFRNHGETSTESVRECRVVSGSRWRVPCCLNWCLAT